MPSGRPAPLAAQVGRLGLFKALREPARKLHCARALDPHPQELAGVLVDGVKLDDPEPGRGQLRLQCALNCPGPPSVGLQGSRSAVRQLIRA